MTIIVLACISSKLKFEEKHLPAYETSYFIILRCGSLPYIQKLHNRNHFLEYNDNMPLMSLTS